MYLEIGMVVLSLVFLLIAVFAIPALIQIRRTAKSIADTLESLNKSLPSILPGLDEITANINQATNTVNHQIRSLSLVVRRVQVALEFLLDVEQIVKASLGHPFIHGMTTATAALKGFRSFLDVLRSSR
jgi:uncharacterized protein YoxC